VPGGNTQRQNMTAWMAGRTDTLGNLSLYAYAFPRQTAIFGPAQVEARINQEPAISQDITLWSQAGSDVIFGNLLMFPIDQTVFYIQPLYLRSTASSAIPELRRVIVVTSDRVVMGDTLAAALSQLTGQPPQTTTDPGVPTDPATGSPATIAEAVERADAAYRRGQAALAEGDWAAYGEAQAELRQALDDLNRLAGAEPAATPVATPTP
jgi:uncharacterized membrane protein (UPF0182 family)